MHVAKTTFIFFFSSSFQSSKPVFGIMIIFLLSNHESTLFFIELHATFFKLKTSCHSTLYLLLQQKQGKFQRRTIRTPPFPVSKNSKVDVNVNPCFLFPHLVTNTIVNDKWGAQQNATLHSKILFQKIFYCTSFFTPRFMSSIYFRKVFSVLMKRRKFC